jgi:hypothetical protein
MFALAAISLSYRHRASPAHLLAGAFVASWRSAASTRTSDAC